VTGAGNSLREPLLAAEGGNGEPAPSHADWCRYGTGPDSRRVR